MIGNEHCESVASSMGSMESTLCLPTYMGLAITPLYYHRMHVIPALINKCIDVIESETPYIEVWGIGDA